MSETDSAESLMSDAGLDWEVEGRPLLVPQNGPENYDNLAQFPGQKAIIRKFDNMPMGIVGEGWNILQNHEVFEFIDSLTTMGLVKYHSAGQFKNGKIVWVQAEFMESEILQGDEHKKCLFFTNAFDGTFSVRIGWTDFRVACYNTFIVAAGEARKNGYTIRHTASMREKISMVKEALVASESEAKRLDMFQKALTRVQMTQDMWTDFTHGIIPDPEKGRNTRAKNAREDIISLSVMGKGQDIPGVQGMAYAALNALTEYVGFHRVSRVRGAKDDYDRQAGRYQSTLFGSGHKLINQGIDILDTFLVNSGIQVETVV